MQRTGLTLSLMLTAGGLSLWAQTSSTPANAAQQVHADLNQLMRGVLYPAANVVFFAQADDPGDVKLIPGHDPGMSTDPLTSTFGGWVAVENAALALAESANLLSIPGRKCSNGAPVPTTDPAWATFAQEAEATEALATAQDAAAASRLADALDGAHRATSLLPGYAAAHELAAVLLERMAKPEGAFEARRAVAPYHL